VIGVWTGKKSHYIPVPQLHPPLVGYILTIQMHLPIYKSPSALQGLIVSQDQLISCSLVFSPLRDVTPIYGQKIPPALD
jgi:hypothetical protein